ncbi:hypothetical protein GCM10010151_42310 [Actinoallomurus spadix]|uniref:Uncharacterized protein n=1 Tax=Actinoallomurus spadix TaxID=79912 RepID=A0ABN0WWU8_9ACTN
MRQAPVYRGDKVATTTAKQPYGSADTSEPTRGPGGVCRLLQCQRYDIRVMMEMTRGIGPPGDLSDDTAEVFHRPGEASARRGQESRISVPDTDLCRRHRRT